MIILYFLTDASIYKDQLKSKLTYYIYKYI